MIREVLAEIHNEHDGVTLSCDLVVNADTGNGTVAVGVIYQGQVDRVSPHDSAIWYFRDEPRWWRQFFLCRDLTMIEACQYGIGCYLARLRQRDIDKRKQEIHQRGAAATAELIKLVANDFREALDDENQPHH